MGSEFSIEEDYCKALMDEKKRPADLPKKKNVAIIQNEIERNRETKTFYD